MIIKRSSGSSDFKVAFVNNALTFACLPPISVYKTDI